MKNFKKIISAILKKAAKSIKTAKTSAIILAGGASERMGVSKQLINLGGIPVVVRSALSFQNCGDIDEIIVVCRSEEKEIVESLMKEYGIDKFKRSSPAGKTRFDSVKNGFEATDPHADLVAVHDAARCLVTPEMISDVVKEARSSGAAIAACRSVDTVKLVDDDNNIISTVKRKKSWNAQTPQVFLRAMLETGIYYPRDDGFSPTDDAELCESLGFKVKVVDCSYENIKITTPADIFVAEKILGERKEK